MGGPFRRPVHFLLLLPLPSQIFPPGPLRASLSLIAEERSENGAAFSPPPECEIIHRLSQVQRNACVLREGTFKTNGIILSP